MKRAGLLRKLEQAGCALCFVTVEITIGVAILGRIFSPGTEKLPGDLLEFLFPAVDSFH
jgi:hypothetical protein